MDLARWIVPFVGTALLVLAAGPARAEDLPDFDDWWNYGDPAATETKFRALLPKAEAAGNADYLAQLWTQIARTHSLRGNFDQAHEILDRVEKSLKADMKTARVRYLLERGRTFNSAKKPAEAKPLFLRAWDIARSEGLDGHACDAAHMVAIVETGDAILEWNRKALALAESSKDKTAIRWVGALCQNIGWTLHQQGKYDEAMRFFDKGLAWWTERKKDGQVRIFRWFKARTLRSMGKPEEALSAQRALLDAYKEAGDEDGFVHEEIAECLTALKKPDEAKPHFAKAYALLEKDPELVADPKRLERLRTLGGVAR